MVDLLKPEARTMDRGVYSLEGVNSTAVEIRDDILYVWCGTHGKMTPWAKFQIEGVAQDDFSRITLDDGGHPVLPLAFCRSVNLSFGRNPMIGECVIQWHDGKVDTLVGVQVEI